MNTRMTLIAGALVGALAPAAGSALAQELTVITAGDQNMVDYINDYLGPDVREDESRREGAGRRHRPRRRRLAEDLREARRAEGRRRGVGRRRRGRAPEDGRADGARRSCSLRIADEIATGKLVTRDTAKNALGADVDGYVMPMFHSQTAIAYNPALVQEPAEDLRRARRMGEGESRQFGYNGIKGGMSGVGFVMGWVYAFTDDAKQLMKVPTTKPSRMIGTGARRAQGRSTRTS